MYSAMTEDPDRWYIDFVGIDSLRTQYADTKEWASSLAKHKDWTYGNEVTHIHIMEDHAIASSKHWKIMPDSTSREELVYFYQSVWMLKKLDNQWKISDVLGGVRFHEEVYRHPPK